VKHPHRDEKQLAVMRARRARMVRQQIEEIEAAVEREWALLHKQARLERLNMFKDTQDWLADTRNLTRSLVTEREPTLLRVLAHVVASAARRAWRAIRIQRAHLAQAPK
jgi:hypothetical protein